MARTRVFVDETVFGEAFSRGVNDERKLQEAGAELREADRKFRFDAKADPLRLDLLNAEVERQRAAAERQRALAAGSARSASGYGSDGGGAAGGGGAFGQNTPTGQTAAGTDAVSGSPASPPSTPENPAATEGANTGVGADAVSRLAASDVDSGVADAFGGADLSADGFGGLSGGGLDAALTTSTGGQAPEQSASVPLSEAPVTQPQGETVNFAGEKMPGYTGAESGEAPNYQVLQDKLNYQRPTSLDRQLEDPTRVPAVSRPDPDVAGIEAYLNASQMSQPATSIPSDPATPSLQPTFAFAPNNAGTMADGPLPGEVAAPQMPQPATSIAPEQAESMLRLFRNGVINTESGRQQAAQVIRERGTAEQNRELGRWLSADPNVTVGVTRHWPHAL